MFQDINLCFQPSSWYFGKFPLEYFSVHMFTVCLHPHVHVFSSLTTQSLHTAILCYAAYALSTLLAHTRALPGYKSCLFPFLVFCSGCCSLWTLGQLFLSHHQQESVLYSLLLAVCLIEVLLWSTRLTQPSSSQIRP